jgi:hypothetical protein
MRSVPRFGMGVLFGMLQACGGGPTANEGADGFEDIGVAEDPLYENTCWTSAVANATITAVPGNFPSAVSANAAYHQDNCPVQWVADVNNIVGRPFTIWAGPESQDGAPPDWCPGFWSFTKVKGWKPGQGWMFVSELTQTGWWGLLPGEVLVFPHCQQTHVVSLPWNHGFTQVRVVVQGGFATSFTRVKVKVGS